MVLLLFFFRHLNLSLRHKQKKKFFVQHTFTIISALTISTLHNIFAEGNLSDKTLTLHITT